MDHDDDADDGQPSRRGGRLMKVYTSGVYGELVLRSATIWPSGLLFGIGDMFFVQNSGRDAG